jgi:hypothetical protein
VPTPPQLVAGDLNLQNRIIDFVGQQFDLKREPQQSMRLLGLLPNLAAGEAQSSQIAIPSSCRNEVGHQLLLGYSSWQRCCPSACD